MGVFITGVAGVSVLVVPATAITFAATVPGSASREVLAAASASSFARSCLRKAIRLCSAAWAADSAAASSCRRASVAGRTPRGPEEVETAEEAGTLRREETTAVDVAERE